MNLQTGKFTAPRTGKYYFSFSGFVAFPVSSTTQLYSRVQLFFNGVVIGSGFSDEIGTGNKYETLSLQSTLNLQNGDQIWLEIENISPGNYLAGAGYTHFNGFLLEEEVSKSFINVI